MHQVFGMKTVPIFVFPVSLDFYVAARHTYKQLLTLYNPYDFAITFKVLSTAPQNFTVIDPEGVIAPQSCVDIVVRYTNPSASHANTNEKFRITMYDKESLEALGKRDIVIKLLEGSPPNFAMEGLNDHFLPLNPKNASKHKEIVTQSEAPQPPLVRRDQPVNVVAVAVSICCMVMLVLPTKPETLVETQWPEWLHIGSNLKLVFSFVLGMVSMLLLKP